MLIQFEHNASECINDRTRFPCDVNEEVVFRPLLQFVHHYRLATDLIPKRETCIVGCVSLLH